MKLSQKNLKILRGYCGGFHEIQNDPLMALFYKHTLKRFETMTPDQRALFLEYASQTRIQKKHVENAIGDSMKKRGQNFAELEVNGKKVRFQLDDEEIKKFKEKAPKVLKEKIPLDKVE